MAAIRTLSAPRGPLSCVRDEAAKARTNGAAATAASLEFNPFSS
jgi:hypothetical protein